MAKSNQTLTDENTLRLVVEGTAAETGTEFVRSLVKNLATALGTSSAWVTEYLPKEQKLRALALWSNGEFVSHFEYFLADTVCQRVSEDRTLTHFPERVIELFARDNDLAQMNAVSYLGAPLLDTDGTVMGHVAVLDNRPMPKDARAVSLFEIFAQRAAAEHRRLKMEREIRAREEQLSTLLETAMDAILVVDSTLKVVRVNYAA